MWTNDSYSLAEYVAKNWDESSFVIIYSLVLVWVPRNSLS